MSEGKKIANGMSISQARKWFRFYFDMFFDKSLENTKSGIMVFDIYLYEKVEKDGKVFNMHDYLDIEEFKRYWSPGFNIILVEIKK